MNFKKYNSIENTFDSGFLEKIIEQGYRNAEYVVQEKVHGSNFSFITNGAEVKAAKRTDLLADGERFYEYEEILEKYCGKILALFAEIKLQCADMQELIVYGELFGGSYKHPEVKKDTRLSTIQKGVFYTPKHEFYVYDLYLQTTENGSYLSVDKANAYFEKFDFLYAKTLFRGNLDACLGYPNAFPSLISGWLGLPQIEDNVCEGVVIRPVEPIYLRNGARIILKNKNERFAEKKSVKRNPHIQKVAPEFSPQLTDLLPVAEQYITENRLNNVISKIGEISVPKDFGKIFGLFSKDILDDFLKENGEKYYNLDKTEQKLLNKQVTNIAANLAKKVLMKR
jgi:Rnl2 family RNA ligase